MQAEVRHFAEDDTARQADLTVDGAPTVPHDPEQGFRPAALNGIDARAGDEGRSWEGALPSAVTPPPPCVSGRSR